MTKLLSLYGKTVTLVTTVFIVSFTVLMLAFMSISASEERDKVRDLEKTILLANSYVRDFIITRDPSDAKETELILQQADKLVEEGIRAENYQRLHNEVLMYLHSINNLISIFQEQGFDENDGLQGQIKALSARIELKMQDYGQLSAQVSFFEARRLEQEFLLRGREETITAFHASIDQIMQDLDKGRFTTEELGLLFADLSEYQHNFDKLVSLRERTDWTREQLSYFRDAIGETLTDVTNAEQVRARRYLWSALGLILFAFVVGIVYSMRVASSVLKPLEHLRGVARRLADGEDLEIATTEDTGDLAELANAFAEVSQQVKLRKLAEKDLNESKEAIQQYANELEKRTTQLDLAVLDIGSAKSEAETASKRKAEFLASMSHEIRTPLNGIIGMTSLLNTDQLGTDQREIVDVIRTSGESLLGLVNHILDFSKIEAGAVTLECEEFDLIQCLEDTLSLVSRQAAEKGLDVSYLASSDVPNYVIGDSSRLRQVLVNLVGNAVKFTNEGEVQIIASVKSRADSSYQIGFEVVDTGIGIEHEKLNSILHPFTQADLSTTRRYGGTGLGLSISQGLVSLMGGSLTVESKPGLGSKFGFDITLVRTESLGAESKEIVFAGQKVLVLNSSPLFGQALSTALLSFGASTVETHDEEEAARLLQSSSFMAAFINEGKHGFDGVAGVAIAGMLCEASPQTPVIVLRHINQQVLSGTSRCLLKPIRRSALRDVLWRVSGIPGKEAIREEGPEVYIESLVEPTNGSVDRAGNAKRAHQPEDRSPIHSAKQTVLLVEDNIVNQKVGVRMLRNLGCEVDVVDRGDKSVEAVQSGKYNIVFMDVQMPEMDGLEATALIRSLGDITQPTIIALTANATTEDRTKCLAAGMDDYASKPVNSQTLGSLLERWAHEPRRASSPSKTESGS
ncbi:MAG: response regulator [Bacteroidetes bacterium]|nr:response regulator [Bacteroidota bacterium]